MKYLIVIERTPTGYSAYCPDIAGCVAAGKSRSTTERSMRSAVTMHLRGLRERGFRLPRPHASCTFVEVLA